MFMQMSNYTVSNLSVLPDAAMSPPIINSTLYVDPGRVFLYRFDDSYGSYPTIGNAQPFTGNSPIPLTVFQANDNLVYIAQQGTANNWYISPPSLVPPQVPLVLFSSRLTTFFIIHYPTSDKKNFMLQSGSVWIGSTMLDNDATVLVSTSNQSDAVTFNIPS